MRRTFFSLLIASATLLCCTCQAEVTEGYLRAKRERKVRNAAIDVAIYAYPLVMMDVAKQYATYTTSAEEYKAPINQFAHQKEFITPLDSFFHSPNVDVLSSTAWLDLSNGPLCLHVPEIAKRYFLFELFDGWTNILASIDPTTTDSKAKDFCLAGPDFRGKVPDVLSLIRSPTSMVYVKGMTTCLGPGDYTAVYAIQAGYQLTPLDSFGKAYPPNEHAPVSTQIASKEYPKDQVSDMRATDYFGTFATLLQANPPASQNDEAILKRMAEIGLTPGKDFDVEDIPSPDENELRHALKDAKNAISDDASDLPTWHQYWKTVLRMKNNWGTDYLQRAAFANFDLCQSKASNIFSTSCDRDHKGYRLNGLFRYVLRIPKEKLPPAKAFWSLTLYTDLQTLSINPINRYAIRSFMDTLVINPDGSCDIYIQHEVPKDHLSNWLPCPKSNFNVMFRLYQPLPQALDTSWVPPPVRCTVVRE